MVFEKLPYVFADEVNSRDIFVAQANIYFDAPIVHLARILNWIGGKDCIGNIKRSAVKGAKTCVIPADAFHCSFHAIGADPVAFFERAIEKQHEAREEIL